MNSRMNLSLIEDDLIDKSLLVPLTNSLYLPGKLVNPDHVIVDVGTGYYVKKVRFGPLSEIGL